MNRLERTVNKLKVYPSWLLSFAVGRIVKFTGTAGISYDLMSRDKVVVSMKNRPKVRNHIGQIHAAAMMLLAETATGMVLGMNVPDDKIPLLKSMNTKFVRRSQGRMQAEATLNEEQQQHIMTTEKGDVIIQVKVTDESGEEPVLCEVCWAWVPKRK
jgi:acyl-coenzyme A thioesterase PaaI-like protein